MGDVSRLVDIGGGDTLIPVSGITSVGTVRTLSAQALGISTNEEAANNGLVAGNRNGDGSFGFQKQTETFRAGAFINTDGDVSAVGEFKRVGENGYVSGAAELSTDPSNNKLVLNVGKEGSFNESTTYWARAGVGAFGSNPELQAVIAGEVEHGLTENGMTTLFANATITYDDHDKIDFKTGVRHGIFEAGVEHDTISHDTQGFVGFTKDFF